MSALPYVAAREVLLDALDALGEQREALILAGAQPFHQQGRIDAKDSPVRHQPERLGAKGRQVENFSARIAIDAKVRCKVIELHGEHVNSSAQRFDGDHAVWGIKPKVAAGSILHQLAVIDREPIRHQQPVQIDPGEKAVSAAEHDRLFQPLQLSGLNDGR